MFGSKKQERIRDDWRAKPIERERAGHLLPTPDTATLAEEIVDRAGVLDANSSKTEKALRMGKVQGTIWDIVVDEGAERLQQVDATAAAGMRVLIERDDFHQNMLFDYLSMHGAPGTVIHNKIVEYLTNEQFTTDFAEVLQEQHAAGKPTLIGYLEGLVPDIVGRDNEAAAQLLEDWRKGLVAHARENLGNAGLSEHYADLDALVNRPDCSTEMVYNFLLNLGADGRAIAEDWRSKLFNTLDPDTQEEMPVVDGANVPPEDQARPAGESNHTPPTEPPIQPEPARQQLSMSELHRAITEALDMLGLEYAQNEDRDDVYLIGRDGVLLMVGAKDMDGVPVGIVIVAIVLKNVECTKELAVDLLKRNGRATFATWEISDGSDGAVDVSFGYQLSTEQLDVGLVARMVNWVLQKSTEEIDALQAKYGGQRAFVFEEKPPPTTIMPTGHLTFLGRYPGYEPAQAMAAFLSVPGKGRPSYQVLRDYVWVFKGAGHEMFRDGYELVVGCCAEPDGTPVVVVTGFCESNSDSAEKVMALMLGEKIALEQSGQIAGNFGEEEFGEIAASGELRQLRPSEVGAIPDSVEGEPASSVVFDRNLRFDGLYHAKYTSRRSYLRFYADGTVLQASTSGEPEQVAHWLGKAHTEVPRGTYAFQGLSIEFSTASSDGTVDYEGQVNDGEIELSSHSYINGHKDRTTYSFVQVALH